MGHVVNRWEEGELALELEETAGQVRVVWRGKSSDREPGRFLVPVLAEVLERARAAGAKLVHDFSALEYMNSSTFTPVVKAIDAARKAGVAIVLEYSLARKWQALSFSALRTFETSDGRITVHGR
jgi:hypothetical protein